MLGHSRPRRLGPLFQPRLARLFWAASLAVGLLAGCASAPDPIDHPVIYDLGAGRAIDEATLLTRLRAADFVLLGERHDNALHHHLQARLVTALESRARPRAVAFEMLDGDQAPALATFLATRPASAAGLAAAVDWANSGWPDWSLYRPIADAALAAGAPIVAANLARSTLRAMRDSGLAALGDGRARRLGLDRPLPEAQARSLATEIAEAHCGLLPAKMIPFMTMVQRARDGTMALALTEAAGAGGAILITGAEHARKDRGVPATLARLAPGKRVASLAFHEVATGELPPTTAALRDLPFDYVWLTPAVDRDDPCAALRRRFHKPATGG